MTTTTRLGVSFAILALLPWCNATASDAELPEERARVVEELRERFRETGSFRAEYRTLGRRGEGTMEVQYDDYNSYIVLHLRRTESGELLYTTVGEPGDAGSDAFTFRITDGAEGKIIRIPTDELMNAFISPVRTVSSVLLPLFDDGEIDIEEERDDELIFEIQEKLSFEATEDGVAVTIGFGFTFSSTEDDRVSWISEELFVEALDVLEGETEIELVFETGRRVRIDRKTGILISDGFPDVDGAESGSIRLTDLEVLGENPLPLERFPDFSDVTFEEVETAEMLAQLEREFTAQIFRELSDFFIEHLPSPRELGRLLEERGDEIEGGVRKMSYRFGKQHAGGEIGDDTIESMVESAFIPMYREFTEQVSDAEEMSFAEFLDGLYDAGTKSLESVDLPLIAAMEREMTVRDQELLAMAPIEIWEVLEILYERIGPVFIDGLSLGVYHHIIDRAKRSDAALRMDAMP